MYVCNVIIDCLIVLTYCIMLWYRQLQSLYILSTSPHWGYITRGDLDSAGGTLNLTPPPGWQRATNRCAQPENTSTRSCFNAGPASTKRLRNVYETKCWHDHVLMLGQRLRRCPSFKTWSCQRFVFAELYRIQYNKASHKSHSMRIIA